MQLDAVAQLPSFGDQKEIGMAKSKHCAAHTEGIDDALAVHRRCASWRDRTSRKRVVGRIVLQLPSAKVFARGGRGGLL